MSDSLSGSPQTVSAHSQSTGWIQFNEPAIARATPDSQLYPDRYSDGLAIILSHLALSTRAEDLWHAPDKHLYAAPSLVCRQWSHILRPLLFRRLTLWTPADVALLTQALRSRTSSWLREHVVTIMFEARERKDALVLDRPAWRVLLRETVALRAVCFRTRYAGSAAGLCANRARLRSGVGLTLRHLALSSVTFTSFSSLCRLVGSFEKLRGVYLEKVHWAVEKGDSKVAEKEEGGVMRVPPRCVTGFTSVELVSMELCTDARTLAWIFAAASLRYTYPMKRDNADNPPDDLLGIVKLVEMSFNNRDWYVVGRRIHDSKYAYAWSVRLAEDVETPSHKTYTALTFVTAPSPSTSPARSRTPWSLQHLIITCAHEPSIDYYDPIFSFVASVQEMFRRADNALAGFAHLRTIDVLYPADMAEPDDLAFATGVVRRHMPKTRDKVRLLPYDLEKQVGLRVEVGDAGVVLEPFAEWWRGDWVYEL